MKNVSFGTDGWRGVIADDFTVENIQLVIQAVMAHLTKEGRQAKVVIGYDTRFMSEYYAKVAAEVAAGNGARVLVSPEPVTTPILSHAVLSESASGGIMVTASHNPFNFNGIKFKAPYGGSATPAITKDIESLIGKTPVQSLPYEKAREKGAVAESDFFGAYRERIYSGLDVSMIKRGGARTAHDCMHGSAGPFARRLWDGLGLELKMMRSERDPYFGGGNPEPIKENLTALTQEMTESGFEMGIATDGDGDRLGVVDGSGAYITPHQLMALLLLHLSKNRGLSGTVVKSLNIGSLVDRIAKDLRLPVVETPVGFKHICAQMLDGDVLIGGEESGGMGIKGHIPERDGLYAALLLLEMMACEGKNLKELLSAMEKRYGRLFYKRRDLKLDARRLTEVSGELKERSRKAFKEFGVAEVKTFDGVKLIFDNGSWVMFRLSGTEPLVRVYAEADDPGAVDRLIERGREAMLA